MKAQKPPPQALSKASSNDHNRCQARLRTVAALCLVVTSIGYIAREMGSPPLISAVSGSCLILFFILEWRRTRWTCGLIVVLALVLAAVQWLLNKLSIETLTTAIDRAAFFTLFLTALSVLREAARTSPLVRRCGKVLVQQPPGRRYLLLTIGAHLFSIMLNVGAINVLGAMVNKAIKIGKGAEQARIARIRKRRMLIATLRGFCGTPIWSPTSISMALILASAPNLSWEEYAPIGLALGVLFVAWGAVLDHFSYPQGVITPQPDTRLNTLIPLIILVALIPMTAFVVSQLTGLKLISALLICVPLIGIIWIARQYRRAGASLATALLTRRISRSFPQMFTDQRNEVAIFASASFVGVILIPLIDPALISRLIIDSNLSNAWLMIVLSWMIVLLAVVGLNAIFTVTVLLGVLHQIPNLDIAPLIQAAVIAVSWSVSTGAAPITTSVRFTSYFGGTSPLGVGLIWNGSFNLSVLLIMDTVLLFIL